MTNVNPITVDRIHIRIPAGIDATTILDLCSMAGCLVSRTLVGAHITGDLDQLRHTLSILADFNSAPDALREDHDTVDPHSMEVVVDAALLSSIEVSALVEDIFAAYHPDSIWADTAEGILEQSNGDTPAKRSIFAQHSDTGLLVFAFANINSEDLLNLLDLIDERDAVVESHHPDSEQQYAEEGDDPDPDDNPAHPSRWQCSGGYNCMISHPDPEQRNEIVVPVPLYPEPYSMHRSGGFAGIISQC